MSREKQDVDDATYGIQLSPKQTSEMKELIQKYHDIVGTELKKTRVAEHKIPTSSRPIRQRPYRLPPAIKDDIIKELNELKDSGIIEESNSDWASPIVVVQKKRRKQSNLRGLPETEQYYQVRCISNATDRRNAGCCGQVKIFDNIRPDKGILASANEPR